jgi:hypothetical protein
LKLAGEQRAVIVVLHGAEDASDITVSDLTVDAGAVESLPSAYSSKRNGVNLLGSRCVIRNVRALRCFGRIDQSKECFAIKAFGGKDNLIEGCEVSDVRGNYCSAIGLRSGEIRNNIVIFPAAPFDGASGRFYWHAYNCEEATNVWVHHNQSFNGTSGYYVDTGFTRGLTVSDNQFNDVNHGVYINMIVDNRRREPAHGVDGVSITNNRIHLNPRASAVVGVLLDHTTVEFNSCDVFENFIQHVVISGNEIGYAPGVTPPKLRRGGKQAVVVASNVPYQPRGPEGFPVGINDVLITDNIIQEQPPGSGAFGFRNKVLSKCTGQAAPNATNVRGRHRTPSAREAAAPRSIEWEP